MLDILPIILPFSFHPSLCHCLSSLLCCFPHHFPPPPPIYFLTLPTVLSPVVLCLPRSVFSIFYHRLLSSSEENPFRKGCLLELRLDGVSCVFLNTLSFQRPLDDFLSPPRGKCSNATWCGFTPCDFSLMICFHQAGCTKRCIERSVNVYCHQITWDHLQILDPKLSLVFQMVFVRSLFLFCKMKDQQMKTKSAANDVFHNNSDWQI